MSADTEAGNFLKDLDYSVLQQCMHCGLCLPACPTYVETLRERSSPRGRIAMMRAVADGALTVGRDFAEEMYYCLGCLACQTACPAGVDYASLFEAARAEVERTGVLNTPGRSLARRFLLNFVFTSRRRLRLLGRVLFIFQKSGLQGMLRRSGLLRLVPKTWRELESLTPSMRPPPFTEGVFESMRADNPAAPTHRVGLLAGCVQDIAFAHVNGDTIAALQANGCEVVLPADQQCCGSLHAHNGEVDSARQLARANIDAFDADQLDAIIVNAGGCGSHAQHYDRLLADDGEYAERARTWSRKLRDVHEFLVEIGVREAQPTPGAGGDRVCQRVTYHESCHLKHGQGVSAQPRQILSAIPGIELVEMTEADWCCGSAGVYNITQPEMSMKLLDRKIDHICATGADIVATGNPGCVIQIEHGLRKRGLAVRVVHPVTLLVEAYGREARGDLEAGAATRSPTEGHTH